VSTWIGVLERVIPHIAVSVKVLGIGELWYNGIETDEPANERIVPSGVIVQQLNVTILMRNVAR
jgi:hypothetical protein